MNDWKHIHPKPDVAVPPARNNKVHNQGGGVKETTVCMDIDGHVSRYHAASKGFIGSPPSGNTTRIYINSSEAAAIINEFGRHDFSSIHISIRDNSTAAKIIFDCMKKRN